MKRRKLRNRRKSSAASRANPLNEKLNVNAILSCLQYRPGHAHVALVACDRVHMRVDAGSAHVPCFAFTLFHVFGIRDEGTVLRYSVFRRRRLLLRAFCFNPPPSVSLPRLNKLLMGRRERAYPPRTPRTDK